MIRFSEVFKDIEVVKALSAYLSWSHFVEIITINDDLKRDFYADILTPDLVFRDPYLLDFLGLTDSYSEKDLETAILREMEKFILELMTQLPERELLKQKLHKVVIIAKEQMQKKWKDKEFQPESKKGSS